MRDAFGLALQEAGDLFPDLLVVDADNSTATRTDLFKQRFPDRFVQVGVAEQNMVGVAIGLAQCGYRVVASTFAAFLLGRGWEAIRDGVALEALNVVLVGTHAGISVGRDGITHMALEDVALTRTLPNLGVVVPADGTQVRSLLLDALAVGGPYYLRISRWGLGEITPPQQPVRLQDPIVLRPGRDCLVLACGLMTQVALQAARELEDQGLDCGVVCIHTVKPLAAAAFTQLVQGYPCLVVAEEHWSTGGLFGAVAELVVQVDPKPCVPVGVPDVFPDGGDEVELFRAYGLAAADIRAAVWTAMAKANEPRGGMTP
jgi:transketolase